MSIPSGQQFAGTYILSLDLVDRNGQLTGSGSWSNGVVSNFTGSVSGGQVLLNRLDADGYRARMAGREVDANRFQGTYDQSSNGATGPFVMTRLTQSPAVAPAAAPSLPPQPSPGPGGTLLDFSGTWSLNVNGFKMELYLKQQGAQIRGWMGVNGVNLQADVIVGTVTGNEIRFTRTDPTLARPQEYRGYLLPHDNPQIEPRFRMTGVDALAGIGSHVGEWNMGWFATRLGPYREEPPR